LIYDIIEESAEKGKTVPDATKRTATLRIKKELTAQYYIGQIESKNGAKTGGYVWIIKRD
jgi:ribosomal protein L17